MGGYIPAVLSYAMPPEGSITHWITEVKDGKSAAARDLWQRCFPRLVRLAREHMRGVPQGMADEEDVALSAMDSFCRAAQEGRLPDLAGRDDLWRILIQKTLHKATDLARHERRQRRGGGRLRSLEEAGVVSDHVAQVIGKEPTPEFAAIMAEECRRLLKHLQDPQLRALALAKMEGYANKEIARQLDCSVRTVERRLKLIRDEWKDELK
jgi:DNA-directed RNA polymerase specialized sigma24 family protein